MFFKQGNYGLKWWTYILNGSLNFTQFGNKEDIVNIVMTVVNKYKREMTRDVPDATASLEHCPSVS